MQKMMKRKRKRTTSVLNMMPNISEHFYAGSKPAKFQVLQASPAEKLSEVETDLPYQLEHLDLPSLKQILLRWQKVQKPF